MIANNIEEMAVVIISFLIIFGFAGAPGSAPSTKKSLSFCELISQKDKDLSFCELISLGKIINSINHHMITKTTNDPVSDIII